MDGGGSRAVSVGESPDITRRQFKMIQCPVVCGSPFAGYLNQSGRDFREERYLETIERDCQAVADRFDIRLFPRPAAEKRQTSFIRFQGEQFG